MIGVFVLGAFGSIKIKKTIMNIKFIDSEICFMNGKEALYFRDNIALLKQIEKTLSKIGPQKFFSDPDQKIQRDREGLVEYFFISALKKLTGKDWWLLQPKDNFPDFFLMTINGNPISIRLDKFELVEIPCRCQTFDEMMSIIDAKLNKGYPENYHLLIFINHKESKEWVNLFNQKIKNYYPFKAIWTVHLLFQNEVKIYSSVVNRIRPQPILHIEVNFNDKKLYKQQFMPNLMNKIETKNGTFLQLKPDVAKELRKAFLKIKLKKIH